MSEKRATYHTGAPALRPETLLEFDDPNFEPPNDVDVRALKELLDLSGGDLANLVGVDARTWRAWTAPPSSERRRQIPFAAWRLLLEKFWIVDPEKLCPDGRNHQFTQTYPMVGAAQSLAECEVAAHTAGSRLECVHCGKRIVRM